MHQPFGDLGNDPLSRNGDRPLRAPVRVAVLESNDLLRDGLAALLSIAPGLALAGAWGNVDEALDEMPERLPDIVLVDVKLPERSGFRALKALPMICPQTRAIMMVECREDRCVVLNPQTSAAHARSLRTVPAAFSGPDDCLQISLKMGAHGVLRKDCAFAEVAQAIRAVHTGQCWMELPTATRLAQQYLLSMRSSQNAARSGAQSLTLRERQVVSLIAHGRSNKEIAHELQLGYSTVKNYVSNILEKLALSDRTQIALYAIQSSAAEAS
jgi:DNA-binding NarL/FixJ family response regulator